MYIFGVDIPIMEMLLVYAVLSGTCLVIMVYELLKLKSLLLMERKELAELGKDVEVLEQEEAKLKAEETKLEEEERILAEEERELAEL